VSRTVWGMMYSGPKLEGCPHRRGDGIRNVFPASSARRRNGCHFHSFVDFSGAHIQGSAEDIGKPEHVVDLLGSRSGRWRRRHPAARPWRRSSRFQVRGWPGEDDGLVRQERQECRVKSAFDGPNPTRTSAPFAGSSSVRRGCRRPRRPCMGSSRPCGPGKTTPLNRAEGYFSFRTPHWSTY